MKDGAESSRNLSQLMQDYSMMKKTTTIRWWRTMEVQSEAAQNNQSNLRLSYQTRNDLGLVAKY